MPYRRQIHITVTALVLTAAIFASGCASSTQVAAERGLSSTSAERGPRPDSLKPSIPIRFVKFKTEDGLILTGRIFGRGEVGVVLGHMYPTTQGSWGPAARQLARNGYRVLTFDFRGYGFSGGRKDIAKINLDMVAAAARLRTETGKVFLVGASMGGTAALRAAGETKVRGVAAISSPKEFMGLDAGRIETIRRPKLFMAAAADGAAPETARRFYEDAGEPRELSILPGAAHGSELFNTGDTEAFKVLLDWLSRYD